MLSVSEAFEEYVLTFGMKHNMFFRLLKSAHNLVC